MKSDMIALVVKLPFKKVRFGYVEDEPYKIYSEVIPSDRLWGNIIYNSFLTLDEKLANELINSMYISTAFLYNEDTLFIPHFPNEKLIKFAITKELLAPKDIKKLRWFPLNKFKEYINLDPKASSQKVKKWIEEEWAYISEMTEKEFYSVKTETNAKLPYLGETSEFVASPFHFSWVEFSKNSGYWSLIILDPSSSDVEVSKLVDTLIKVLEFSSKVGLGSDTSLGFGKFEFNEENIYQLECKIENNLTKPTNLFLISRTMLENINTLTQNKKITPTKLEVDISTGWTKGLFDEEKTSFAYRKIPLPVYREGCVWKLNSIPEKFHIARIKSAPSEVEFLKDLGIFILPVFWKEHISENPHSIYRNLSMLAFFTIDQEIDN